MIDPFAWLALVAIPGHISWLLWVGNTLHARPIDHRRLKPFSKLLNLGLALGAAALALWGLVRLAGPSSLKLPAMVAALDRPIPGVLKLYVSACVVNTVVGFVPWLVRRIAHREADVLLSDEARLVDLRAVLKPPLALSSKARLLTAVPGNQALQVAVHTKRLRIPNLPAALAGLRVAHLSDLHLTGDFDRRIYDHFADLTQALEPDLVALTGDLVEKESCWEWFGETFARFRGPHGGYFVLGNHDVRIDHERSRRLLTEAGLVNLAAECRTIEVRGAEILLCGNELPWLGPPPPPPRRGHRRGRETLRLLLAHTPDQLPWARQHEFDLMLAGHVHGGQIQFPPLGPILAPSLHGVHYASGVFHESPTVLHVGRGTSAKLPLRFFCPPEITLLILEPGEAAGSS